MELTTLKKSGWAEENTTTAYSNISSFINQTCALCSRNEIMDSNVLGFLVEK